ncbi:hypothetical protein QYE76_026222 [Lolium multiflorum]|uniref:Protein FAR1-RELATED SEQUENCE n=1 Tax=Lolium multiflorum TaxID=4521 RepID=A0AAD8VXC6_LOLMU|nr:hypothetical protein QYE76_026222 [Lolium multiflorum]
MTVSIPYASSSFLPRSIDRSPTFELDEPAAAVPSHDLGRHDHLLTAALLRHRAPPSLLHDLLFTGISPELDEPPSAPHSVTIDLLHQGISSRRSRHSHLHDPQGLLDETPLLHAVTSSSVSPASRSSAGHEVEVLYGGHEEDEYSDMEVGFDEYSVEVGLHHEESSSENKSEVISGADNGREHHSQADPNIVSNEYKMHSMEEHCKILDMTFSSEPAAFVWYNSYAREHGFSIRKDILKRAKRGKRGKGEKRLRREKRKLIAKGDAATALGIMAARKKSDPEFFFDYQVDDEGRLKSMFWCDSQSRQDYQDFGDVVVFDSTYKMNRYAMPFIPFVGLNNHLDLIMHYENAIVRIRESKAEDDCICSQSLPVAVTESKEIEVALAHAFSPANFYILQQDVKKLGDLEIFEEYMNRILIIILILLLFLFLFLTSTVIHVLTDILILFRTLNLNIFVNCTTSTLSFITNNRTLAGSTSFFTIRAVTTTSIYISTKV